MLDEARNTVTLYGVVDLHTHSTASDGTLAPAELIATCHTHGVEVVALTDHDTLSGIPAAVATAERYGIELIAGIELEIAYEGPGAFHLLGLGIQRYTAQLSALLHRIGQLRRERNEQILKRMREAGIEVQHAQVAHFAGGDILARPHFARYLVERGIVRSEQEAFDRYLGDGKPFWQPKGALTLEEAAAALHSAGGRTILAHPMTLYLSINSVADRLVEWKALGLDGIEAYHPNARYADCRKLEALGQSLGLLVTAGSDYHGPERSDRPLGYSSDGYMIEERFAAGFSRAGHELLAEPAASGVAQDGDVTAAAPAVSRADSATGMERVDNGQN